MSEAQKSHSQTSTPSSSSAEERVVEDSRVPTGGEPEHENDHGAGLIHQTIPDVEGTEPRPTCRTCAFVSNRENLLDPECDNPSNYIMEGRIVALDFGCIFHEERPRR